MDVGGQDRHTLLVLRTRVVDEVDEMVMDAAMGSDGHGHEEQVSPPAFTGTTSDPCSPIPSITRNTGPTAAATSQVKAEAPPTFFQASARAAAASDNERPQLPTTAVNVIRPSPSPS